MQARAPLMIEHRLIERMIAILEQTVEQIKGGGKIDPVFVDTAVDFIRTYADRVHHGKEEDILFTKLDQKPLSEKDRQSMDDLVQEHALGRITTKRLIEANNRYRKGDRSALPEIAEKIELLIGFYPKHIEKEDKIFFPESRRYFSEQEDQAMLNEFWEFDRKMIHEKYKLVVETLKGAGIVQNL